MSQYLTTIGGTYAKEPIFQGEDSDFSWALEMFDGEDDTTPSNLTGRTFSFEVSCGLRNWHRHNRCFKHCNSINPFGGLGRLAKELRAAI